MSDNTHNGRQLVGAARFFIGERTLDMSPVYLGEDPFGSAVRLRAERSATMLRDPVMDPPGWTVSTASVSFYPANHIADALAKLPRELLIDLLDDAEGVGCCDELDDDRLRKRVGILYAQGLIPENTLCEAASVL